MLVLYRLAAFVSAALLFTVQPMFARLLLPVLGGAPSVWTTAQVFFQVALLAGYGYAHASTQRLGPRRQARVHAALLLLPLFSLPLGFSSRAPGPPAGASPVPWLLFTLLVTVGPSFLAVSASGPLLARWLSATGSPRARDPYFLYATSNLGSMAGLVAYPTLIEPRLPLRAQCAAWAWGYGALVILMAACAWFVGADVGDGRGEKAVTSEGADGPPTPRRILRWVALAFVPSSLMLGATTHLTMDVAATPLLWVLPLGLYLLTFILAFLARPLLSHRALVRAAPVAVVLGLVAAGPLAEPVWLFLAVVLAAFFTIAMVCHGELARDRPSPAHATAFYLWISVGGALGSAFCALLAPVLFRSAVEYSVTLVAAAFLLPAPAGQDEGPRRVDVAFALVVGAACAGGILAKKNGFLSDGLALAVSFAVLSFAVLLASPRPLHLGLSLSAALVAAHVSRVRADGVIAQRRSFFGALAVTERIEDGATLRRLYHGATLHGVQATAPGARDEPLSYYGPEGPIGQLFLHGPIRPDARIAVVGLGVGSLIAYARPEQRWTFYEIDPEVVKIAEDARFFTYLADARAPYAIVLGDARRSLAEEASARFSLIVLDAYSSDAIPVHLLTREAVLVYLARLEEHGVLALHVSNRHLDLTAVVAGIAGGLGLACLEQTASPSPSEAARGKRTSRWALLARRPEDFGVLGDDARWSAPSGKRVEWTDDASSVFAVWR